MSAIGPSRQAAIFGPTGAIGAHGKPSAGRFIIWVDGLKSGLLAETREVFVNTLIALFRDRKVH